MKKTFCSIAAGMLLASSLAFADESMLIDFTLLDVDCVPVEVQGADGETETVMTQNKRTVMDFSVAAGATFTDDQKEMMKTSLALHEWEVVLNASARNVMSLADSKVLAAPVKESSNQPFAGKNVMGVRVVFPEWASNASAKIVPPFDIPAYQLLCDADDDGVRQEPSEEAIATDKRLFEGDTKEEGYGLVTNVGTLKSIAVTTMGMNFPHALYVLLKDTDGVERRYYMGNLGFDGWKTLIWNNPQYLTEIRNREVRVYPIYPRGLPFVKFAGFYISRDASSVGGNFIGYFKDVKIIYDKAVLTTERDIADEDLWGIIRRKENQRQADEMIRFGNKQVNRYLENAKLAPEDTFTPSIVGSAASEDDGQQAAESDSGEGQEETSEEYEEEATAEEEVEVEE